MGAINDHYTPPSEFILNLFRINVSKVFLTQNLLKMVVNPFPNDKNLDSSKLKEFAHGNCKFDENGRKLSTRVENTVGEKEKLLVTRISPFPTLFSKDLYCRHVKNRACWGKG